MLTRTSNAKHIPLWQRELGRAVSDPAELLTLLELDRSLLPGARRAADLFRLRVPRGFAARMQPGDINDPLLRQVLPLQEEALQPPGFITDPVGDLAAMPVPGLLHKYRGRVLLVTTGACAVHCRYCFRRHFPYAEASPARDDWRAALAYIAADPSIREVILSGGDPFMLNDRRLRALIRKLEAISHLRRLRIHTRLPVVLPERVDAALLDWLAACRLKTVIVLHANHANEIDHSVAQAVSRLAGTGAVLLNQAVLLRGVNDSIAAMESLSETLFTAGILPYYLHLLDKVQGAAHFEVTVERARKIMRGLSARLPGYLLPRLVVETAGGEFKLPVV